MTNASDRHEQGEPVVPEEDRQVLLELADDDVERAAVEHRLEEAAEVGAVLDRPQPVEEADEEEEARGDRGEKAPRFHVILTPRIEHEEDEAGQQGGRAAAVGAPVRRTVDDDGPESDGRDGDRCEPALAGADEPVGHRDAQQDRRRREQRERRVAHPVVATADDGRSPMREDSCSREPVITSTASTAMVAADTAAIGPSSDRPTGRAGPPRR